MFEHGLFKAFKGLKIMVDYFFQNGIGGFFVVGMGGQVAAADHIHPYFSIAYKIKVEGSSGGVF